MLHAATRVAIAMTLAQMPAIARGQASLYGQQPGRDAAFVRFVNTLEADVMVDSDPLPPQVLGTAAERRIGRYAVLDQPAGRPLTVRARVPSRGGKTAEIRTTVRIDPGSIVSIVLERDQDGALKIVPLPQRADASQSRARLSFYNVAPACGPASLTLEPAGVPVFRDIPPNAEASRTVNPVRAQLGTSCAGHHPTASLDGMEPGGAYSLWLMTLVGEPVLLQATDTLPSWHP